MEALYSLVHQRRDRRVAFSYEMVGYGQRLPGLVPTPGHRHSGPIPSLLSGVPRLLWPLRRVFPPIPRSWAATCSLGGIARTQTTGTSQPLSTDG